MIHSWKAWKRACLAATTVAAVGVAALAIRAQETNASKPDRALERAADLGGPLARILKIALEEQRTSGRPLFGRGKVPGLLLDVADRYDLPALRAFVAQIDMAARTGAAGPELMSGLAHTLIVEYKDRALREAEALDSRLAVPSVGFFFMPFLFLVLVPLLRNVPSARLFDERTGLYDHSWFADMDPDPRFYWGRGAGWALMATATVPCEFEAAVVDVLATKLVQRGQMRITGDGTHVISVVHVDDVVRVAHGAGISRMVARLRPMGVMKG